MAKKNLSYKRTLTRSLKVIGTLNITDNVIEVDGDSKSILGLLSDFDNCDVVLTVQTKAEEDLDEPRILIDD